MTLLHCTDHVVQVGSLQDKLRHADLDRLPSLTDRKVERRYRKAEHSNIHGNTHQLVQFPKQFSQRRPALSDVTGLWFRWSER